MQSVDQIIAAVCCWLGEPEKPAEQTLNDCKSRPRALPSLMGATSGGDDEKFTEFRELSFDGYLHAPEALQRVMPKPLGLDFSKPPQLNM